MNDLSVFPTTKIHARDLHIAYERTTALDIPYLTAQGRIIAIIGHNGSGKSTFLKSVLRLLAPKRGSLDSELQEGSECYPLVPEKHMAFSPENGAVFADVTVENYLKLWCRIKQGRASYLRHEGAGILEELEVTPLLRKLGRELSKGQRRRVQIAAGFLISPKLFLFDEPFDGLDVSQSNRLSLILERKSREMSMIISSHRMEVVERLADHVIVLEKGSILASGSVDEVCTELCGQSILISNLGALVGQFLPELRAAFKQSVIQSVGEQISVIGRDITLEHLHAFFNEHHGGNPLLRIARPTLDDAMRYHLER